VEGNNIKYENQPLISILVITYNSSKYILETLNSAQNQSYNNLELIITDDCSTDDTFDICNDWIKDNSKNFRDVKLVKPEKNRGIAGNCNHGLKFCQGKWVKLIAGDDILLPNCISEYQKYTLEHEELFLFSYPKILMDSVEEKVRLIKEKAYALRSHFYELSPEDQLAYMIIRDLPMSASTFFFNNVVLKNLGGFDESFLQEDRPLYMKLTYLGYKLGNVDQQLVLYRIHSANLSTKNKKPTPVNEFWFKNVHKVVKQYLGISSFLKRPLIFIEYYNRYLVNSLVLALGNKFSVFRVIRKLRWLSPLYFRDKNKYFNC
jgi:glycosyltransferase involved in cell wall biosynthesis